MLPLLVRSVRGRKLNLTVVLKNIHGIWVIFPEAFLYSHEFSDSGYPVTSPDTGIGHDDDVVAVPSPHGTGGSLAGQADAGGGRLQPMRIWFTS